MPRWLRPNNFLIYAFFRKCHIWVWVIRSALVQCCFFCCIIPVFAEAAALCLVVAIFATVKTVASLLLFFLSSVHTVSTVLKGTKVVSSGAPSPFSRISRSRCSTISLYGFSSR